MPWVRSNRGYRYESPPEPSEEELRKELDNEIAIHLAADYVRDPNDPNKLIDKSDPEKYMIVDPEKFTLTNSPKLNEFLDSFNQGGEGGGA